jgi:hypothetical protein
LTICSHCHGTGLEPPADPVAELAAWLAARGHLVDAFLRTDERGAAAALGLAAPTLRNDRCIYGRLPFVRTSSGAIRYELSRIVVFARVGTTEDRRTLNGRSDPWAGEV